MFDIKDIFFVLLKAGTMNIIDKELIGRGAIQKMETVPFPIEGANWSLDLQNYTRTFGEIWQNKLDSNFLQRKYYVSLY